jgi:hypothetical protein
MSPAPIWTRDRIFVPFEIPAAPWKRLNAAEAEPPVGISPTASSTSDSPLLFKASPKQNSDSYPLRGPLFGAIPNAPVANVVVHLSVSIVPSGGTHSPFSGLLFSNELPDNSKNPEDQAEIQRIDGGYRERGNPLATPWDKQHQRDMKRRNYGHGSPKPRAPPLFSFESDHEAKYPDAIQDRQNKIEASKTLE